MPMKNLLTQAVLETLAGCAIVAAIVTAAVTYARAAEGAGLVSKYEIGDKVTVWALDMDDPQDNIPFRFPHPFPSKEVCEAFIASDPGQKTVLELRISVLREKGPDYKVGEPLCRQVVMDHPSQPGIDL